ncbi:hypothetical protein EDD18DRAFT_1465264 [Armillaria luteobubalina]|uniref:Uncharacterized protein n=1 Tax=Armillaria luteobubalina TaxID=153913 RepID=A0AA39UK62_9AGAR|nr:hypothetical protein EDD18DRAFT_1465264 [Armillaria luteobubalina]
MDLGPTARHTTSSMGRRTISTATHLSRPLIAPSQARSRDSSSLSQYHEYRSDIKLLKYSDEEILEELARRRRRRERKAPSELPRISSLPVHSPSERGPLRAPAPTSAQPAASPSHVGSRVCASPPRVANLSPSRSPSGSLPTLSLSSGAHSSLLPPRSRLAAALNRSGSWVSAPLHCDETYSPPPLLSLSEPAHVSFGLHAATSSSAWRSAAHWEVISPSQDVPCSSVLSLASLPHVKPTLLDHQEVPLTLLGLACVPQNAVVITHHYVPVLLPPRSTSFIADIPSDSRHSSLNRKISAYSIQSDKNIEPENLSHGSSNFDNNLKAAVATLSLSRQLGECDVAFSQHRNAYLTLGGLPLQACFNRGRVMAKPPEVIPTCSSLVEQLQSTFTKQDLAPPCKFSELSPQHLVKAELFLIHAATKSKSPALCLQQLLQQSLQRFSSFTITIDG